MSGLSPNQEVQDSPEYRALTGWLSSPTKTLDHALDEFCEPVENQYMKTCNPSDVHELLWRAWRAFVAVAADVPHDSDARTKLVGFIVKLRSRPDLEKQDQTCTVWDAVVWKGLPIFGAEMREAWNHTASDSSPQKHQRQWVNLNAFTASLVATLHSTSNLSPDFSLYCIWTVRSTFEEPDPPSSIGVQAAAVWLLYAAPAIWDFCRQEKSFEGKVAKPGANHSDGDWTGFNTERWRAWAQRMKEAEQDSSSEDAKRQAGRARRAMKAAAEK